MEDECCQAQMIFFNIIKYVFSILNRNMYLCNKCDRGASVDIIV